MDNLPNFPPLKLKLSLVGLEHCNKHPFQLKSMKKLHDVKGHQCPHKYHVYSCLQIYSQPLFAAVERKFKKYHPDSKFVNNEYKIKLPLLPCFRLNLLRLCFRSLYVASTTALAVMFPFFNQVLGVLGALNFWPVMIYFPIQMYLKQNEVRSWTPMWIILQTLKVACLVVSIVAFIGSVEGLISSKFS